MLAALGDPEHGSRRASGLTSGVRYADSTGRPCCSDRIEDVGEEIKHLNVDCDHSVAAEVAQEVR